MGYNMTAFGESNHILGMGLAVNEASSGMVGVFAVISVFFILLVALMRRNPPAESFFTASTVTGVWSLFLFGMGFINVEWLVGVILLFTASAVSLYLTNKT